MLVVGPLTQLVKICLLALTIFTVLISIESKFTTHVGEYLALISAGDGGHDVSGQRRRCVDDLRRARTDEPVALHPDGVQLSGTSSRRKPR